MVAQVLFASLQAFCPPIGNGLERLATEQIVV
jgi:hypothetical protein